MPVYLIGATSSQTSLQGRQLALIIAENTSSLLVKHPGSKQSRLKALIPLFVISPPPPFGAHWILFGRCHQFLTVCSGFDVVYFF